MNVRTLFLIASIVVAPSAFAETKVLIIGDSHTVGDFGSGLVETLRAQTDVRVSVEASCGSRPAHFLGTSYRNAICSWDLGYDVPATDASKHLKSGPRPLKGLAELIDERVPNLIVIALGTNQYPMKSAGQSKISDGELDAALAKAKGEIERAIAVVTSRHLGCVWVGPPSERFDLFSEKLQNRFETLFERVNAEHGCRFVKSRALTDAKDTAKDRAMHIHYYGTAGRKWGRDVATEILPFVRVANTPPTARMPAGTPESVSTPTKR